MDLQNLRERLSKAVRASQKSQADFAALHEISHSTLNKFLMGHLRNPRLSTMQEFERAIARTKS